MHWRRKWQPTPVFLLGESQGRGSLVGCRLWGRTESDTTEATQQQQQQQTHIFTMELIKHLSCAYCAIDFQILFMQERLIFSLKLGRVGSLSKEGLVNFVYYPVF